MPSGATRKHFRSPSQAKERRGGQSALGSGDHVPGALRGHSLIANTAFQKEKENYEITTHLSVGGGGVEKHRDRQTETERQIETNRETRSERDKHTEGDTVRERQAHRRRETETEIERQTETGRRNRDTDRQRQGKGVRLNRYTDGGKG